ncbi:MAG: DUF128 domain-containing protein [Euryarchaeota archaeon]|nr:DUF128 domain-containing protein [Euryarchaeota archaeon]
MAKTIDEQRLLDILSILKDSGEPLGATIIARRLEGLGHDIGERMARNYLQILDEKGFTKKVKRRGRVITEEGIAELKAEKIHERVGFIKSVIQDLSYQVTYNHLTRDGDIIVNISLIEAGKLEKALSTLRRMYESGWMISPLIKVFSEGEEVYGVVIPKGKAAICTVCSITIDGILVSMGIPTDPIYGGVVEVRNNKPERFVEIIRFDGSSLDPLELFMAKGMTNVLRVAEDGRGWILANYREIPASSRKDAMEVLDRISTLFKGIMMIGEPGEKVLGLLPSARRCGIAVIGGLTPIAAVEEAGIATETKAIHGLMPIKTMKHIEDFSVP